MYICICIHTHIYIYTYTYAYTHIRWKNTAPKKRGFLLALGLSEHRPPHSFSSRSVAWKPPCSRTSPQRRAPTTLGQRAGWDMGVSMVMAVPQNRWVWVISWKIPLKWMTAGTPILGHLHMGLAGNFLRASPSIPRPSQPWLSVSKSHLELLRPFVLWIGLWEV